MSVPFRLPVWRRQQIAAKFARQDHVVRSATEDVEKILLVAIDHILESPTEFREPGFVGLDSSVVTFYERVIREAFVSSKEEKGELLTHKRLMGGPPKLPNDLKSLDQVLKNRRYWSKIMRRAKALSTSLRKQYLMKLRKQFSKLLPLINSGEADVRDVKKKLVESWRASKPRVETIFRTETTNYFAKTQVAVFEDDPEIIGFLFDSVRDSSRTKICQSRHGLVYRPGSKLLQENTPSCHYNCRSHLIALANTPFNRKLLKDPSRDPSTHSVAPLPSGWRR